MRLATDNTVYWWYSNNFWKLPFLVLISIWKLKCWEKIWPTLLIPSHFLPWFQTLNQLTSYKKKKKGNLYKQKLSLSFISSSLQVEMTMPPIYWVRYKQKISIEIFVKNLKNKRKEWSASNILGYIAIKQFLFWVKMNQTWQVSKGETMLRGTWGIEKRAAGKGIFLWQSFIASILVR